MIRGRVVVATEFSDSAMEGEFHPKLKVAMMKQQAEEAD